MAEITGVVSSIIYRNTENGWTVLELSLDEGEKLTVVGALPRWPAKTLVTWRTERRLIASGSRQTGAGSAS